MKKSMLTRLFAVMAFAMSAMAMAQTYPYTTPTYIPTAILAPSTYSAPADPTYLTSGISTVSLRVSGTCTALAGTPQVSNDGTNWSTVDIKPIGGGALAQSVSGTGMWRVNTSGMTKFRLHITALSASCTVAMAGTEAFGASNAESIADPCASPAVTKVSAVIDQSSSATTKVVDAVASKVIYVCGFVATAVGTNPTFTWTSGTHVSADCDTTAAVLSGAMNPSATAGVVSYSPGISAFKTAASFQLCLTTAATSTIKGVLTYVQQ